MKKGIIFLYIFVIILACVLRICAFCTHNFYLVPDEAHSLQGVRDSFALIFSNFSQGANFLPLYRLLLKLTYDIVGFSIMYYKIPSLIAGILSVFVFFDLSKKIFKNQIVVLASLLLFAINFNLIFYSSQVKPYEIDVLLCLIVLNFSITFKDKILSNKNIFFMLIVSLFIIFSSFTAIVISQLCVVVMFISNKQNRAKLATFELAFLSILLFEYFTYISQISSDDSLKAMWLSDSFFFTPNSLEALNALVNFSHFNFFWWDSSCSTQLSNVFLIFYLFVFILGVVNLIREKSNGVIFVLPVIFFLILSCLKIYPFCNRPIIFLIPIFILILSKAFDYENKKIYSAICVILFMTLFLFHVKQYEYFPFLLNKDEKYLNMYKEYVLPLNKISENEYILHTGHPFYYCLDNQNVKKLENYSIEDDFNFDNIDKIYLAFCLVFDEIEDVDKFESFLEQKGYKKHSRFWMIEK